MKINEGNGLNSITQPQALQFLKLTGKHSERIFETLRKIGRSVESEIEADDIDTGVVLGQHRDGCEQAIEQDVVAHCHAKYALHLEIQRLFPHAEMLGHYAVGERWSGNVAFYDRVKLGYESSLAL